MNTISSLLVLLLIAREASTLSCNHCNDEFGWESCNAKVQIGQCDAIITSDLHRNLQNLNPSLPIRPAPNRTYRCYKLEIKFKITQGSSSVMYEQGCTYVEANFCDGWDMNVLEQVNCTTTGYGVPDVDDGAVDESTESPVQNSGLPQTAFSGWLMMVIIMLIYYGN